MNWPSNYLAKEPTAIFDFMVTNGLSEMGYLDKICFALFPGLTNLKPDCIIGKQDNEIQPPLSDYANLTSPPLTTD